MFGKVLVFVSMYGVALARVAPDYIHVCPSLTPECLKKTIQDVLPIYVKGIPSLNMTSIDPLILDVMEVEPQPGFKLSLNGKMTGIRNCVIDSAKYNKNKLDLDLHCNLTFKGKYKASGRVLIVNINGDGDAKIKTNNITLNAKLNFEDQIRDGVTYHVLKNHTVKHRFGDRVQFVLTNLLKGNPEISQAVLLFVNENWKEVARELGVPIVDIAVEQVLNIVKKMFNAVPKTELFP